MCLFILILYSRLCLGMPRVVGLPVNILKALLPSSIMVTCPGDINLLDLIALTILGDSTYYLC